MTEQEAFDCIVTALENTLDESVEITQDTDLIDEDILDSLDGMIFLLEIENATGKKLPEEIDLVEEGYYKIPKLQAFLIE